MSTNGRFTTNQNFAAAYGQGAGSLKPLIGKIDFKDIRWKPRRKRRQDRTTLTLSREDLMILRHATEIMLRHDPSVFGPQSTGEKMRTRILKALTRLDKKDRYWYFDPADTKTFTMPLSAAQVSPNLLKVLGGY